MHQGTLSTATGSVPITYEVRNGLAFLDDDILLGDAETQGTRPRGVAIGNDKTNFNVGALWPSGVIPYSLDGDLGSALNQTIQSAIDHIEARTPLRFVVRTTSSRTTSVSSTMTTPPASRKSVVSAARRTSTSARAATA